MDSTIFYSWQSDNDAKSSRYFIQDALKKAIKKLNASLDFEEAPRLDQDTKDVPGSPEITNTILNKIDNCSIFVADLSFIARTDANKRIPNPNVLIELGYAFKAISSGRIITVMNEAFGCASEGLPFDLAHRRWPIRYNLPANASVNERKEEESKLVTVLSDAIKAVYQSGDLEVSKDDKFVGTLPKWHSSCFLADGDLLCKLPQLNTSESKNVEWNNAPQAFLRLIPHSPIEGKSQKAIFEATKQYIRPFGNYTHIWEERNKYGAVFWEADSPDATSTLCFTQVFKSGEVWGVSKLMQNVSDKDCIPIKETELLFCTRLPEYVTFLYNQLKIKGSLSVILGLSDVENFRLKHPGFWRSNGICLEDEIIYEAVIKGPESAIEDILIPFFENIWDACGATRPRDE